MLAGRPVTPQNAPGTTRDAPGTPRDAPGTPRDALGRPWDALQVCRAWGLWGFGGGLPLGLGPEVPGRCWEPPKSGLVVGFAFLGSPLTPPLGRPWNSTWSGRVPSGAPGRTPRSTRSLGLGFLNNLRESRKGRSPRQGHCPSTWRCSSRST